MSNEQMTIKSAEEIIKNLSEFPKLNETAMAHYAKGFLELAKRVEPLVEALKVILDEVESDRLQLSTFARINAKEALKLWKEIKGTK